MFPSQLTVARKSRNGTVRPVFLDEGGSDYCSAVTKLFHEFTNRKRREIEDAVRELELKSQNHKIIRGISLIMLRKSVFAAPSPLNAEWVRMQAFTRLGHPAVTPRDRESVLDEIAASKCVLPMEVEEGLYADMEGEQILVGPYNVEPGRLAMEFNLEQVETLLLKCSELRIGGVEDWHGVIAKLKRLSLLFSASVNGDSELESIAVSGPLSVLEKTERYGVRLARLFRYLSRLGRWSVAADLTMKNRETGEKKQYSLSLDDASSSFFPPSGEIGEEVVPPPAFPWPVERAKPLLIGSRMAFPDLKVNVGSRTVLIDFSRPEYARETEEMLAALAPGCIDFETFYVLEKGDRRVDGHLNFEGNVDWRRVVSYLRARYDAPADVQKPSVPDMSADREIIDEMERALSELFPDAAGMIEYIQSKGFAAPGTLEMLGYAVRWAGLEPAVERNNSNSGLSR